MRTLDCRILDLCSAYDNAVQVDMVGPCCGDDNLVFMQMMMIKISWAERLNVSRNSVIALVWSLLVFKKRTPCLKPEKVIL